MSEPIDVIEVRRASNGFVVSCFFGGNRWTNDQASVRGYSTYLVEGDDPEKIGSVVAKALREHAITTEVSIPPARALP